MSLTAFINGRVIRNEQVCHINVITQDGKIIMLIPGGLPSSFEGRIVDLKNAYLLPGFIDVHTHGGYNIDVNHANGHDLGILAEKFASQGTTSFNISIVTDEEENVTDIIQAYHDYKDLKINGAKILGIHLEGPFLSHEYKGSMPEHLLIEYSEQLLAKYVKTGKGAINYITVAPEVSGVLDNIPDMIRQGMRVSIGHSAATYDQAVQAIESGASVCTHTFNAMRLFHQHEPAIMGAVLENPNVYCEAICDGRHLHPATVRLLLATKGWDKVIAITDSIMAAGLPDGKYKLGVNDIIVKDGDAKLAYADVRAGSTLTTIQALRNIIKFTGQPIEKVSQLLSKNPATMLGIYDQVGSIDVGKRADFVIIDQSLEVLETVVDGISVYRK